jgi:predicted nucleic acid-binding Zn ribbon protein
MPVYADADADVGTRRNRVMGGCWSGASSAAVITCIIPACSRRADRQRALLRPKALYRNNHLLRVLTRTLGLSNRI